MIKTFRKNHAIIFCILAVLVCWGAVFKLVGLLGQETIGYLDISDRAYDAVGTIFADGLVGLFAVFVLWLTGRLVILKKHDASAYETLSVAAVPLCFYCVVIAMFAIMFATNDPAELSAQADMTFNPGFDAVSVLIIVSYLFVGFTEEVTLRGIVAQTLLEHFGTQRAGIWKAAIISGVMFGLIHCINFAHSPVDFVVGQIFGASCGGILYAAMYFRTGNIWIVVITHGLNDIMAATVTWLGGVDFSSAISTTSGPSVFPYAMGILELSLAIFLLRKKKIGMVEQNWPEFEQWRESADEAEGTNDKSAEQESDDKTVS